MHLDCSQLHDLKAPQGQTKLDILSRLDFHTVLRKQIYVLMHDIRFQSVAFNGVIKYIYKWCPFFLQLQFQFSSGLVSFEKEVQRRTFSLEITIML